MGSNITRGEDWLEDSTPELSKTNRFRSAREDVLRQLKPLRKGESITYGHLSRYVKQDHIDVLDAALLDLVAERAIIWNPNAPLPTKIYKA